MSGRPHHNAAAWLLDRNVEEGRGDRTALICGDEHLTYADGQRQVWRAQHALAALDVRTGERVAMVVDDEPAFVAWFLGGLRSGVVPVPLSTMLTAADLAAIVADSGAGVVAVSSAYAGHLAAIADAARNVRHAVVLDRDSGVDAADAIDTAEAADTAAPAGPQVPVHRWSTFDDTTEAPVAPTAADTPGFWLYSSGTTGLPKGVMHRHANLRATAGTYARDVLRIGPDDCCLSVAKLFFAYGLGNSLTFPFSVGATAVLNPARPTPAGVADLLTRHRPTLFFAAPGFVAALLDAQVPAETFASVRLTVTAGESLPAELHRRFGELVGHPVLDGIGSTEALHIFCSNHDGDTEPGTSGSPVAGYEIELRDEDDQLVAGVDQPGYLHVRGPSIATGYWCRTEATQAAFRGDWLRTGDVYVRTAGGHYRFLGRNSDMIKAGGIWVSPAEVESVLVEHPDVLEAAVVGARNESGLETVVAFLVPRRGHGIDADAIDAHCRDRMAAFKRPRQVVPLDSLPKTATGKVQRFALRAQLKADPA